MIRKSEAINRIAPLLGIGDGEARLWARHLREAKLIQESLPGHGVSPITEEELVNFVAAYACCRHAKHAPQYVDRVLKLTRSPKIEAEDPEKRALPAFLGQREFGGAFRQLIWDVYGGDFSEWGRTEGVEPPNTGNLLLEFGQDAAYVEVSGARVDPSGKRVAYFNAFYGDYWQPGAPPKTYRRDVAT